MTIYSLIKGSPSIFDIDITHMCKKVAKMTGFFCEYHLFYLAKENNIGPTFLKWKFIITETEYEILIRCFYKKRL